MEDNRPTLVVITGPTGSGKTDTAIVVARALGAEIISADSRQIYRGIPVGTAAPTPRQLEAVPHHMVGILGLEEYYSAARFEEDVVGRLLPELFARSPYVVLCGGSMMYVDAVCNGIDDIPTISQEVREQVAARFACGGLDAVRSDLLMLDPAYYGQVDLRNGRRLIHAVEICLQAGRPYSELRTHSVKQRPFRIVKTGLALPRAQLFDRINRRVLRMVDDGLVEEARRVYPLRACNSLNTVGYKEMFAWIDGQMDFDTAVARIQKNTRVYAKKQMTWYAKDAAIRWFSPDNVDGILALCRRP